MTSSSSRASRAGWPDRQRVLCVLETAWDRKQLAACRAAWQERVELCFPEPADADCAADFDALGFVDAAAAGRFGRIDGVTSSSDYPGAIVSAAIAARLGLPGPGPERVIGASHKYYARLAQRDAVPEAVPRFALVDPRRPDAPAPLAFPFFLKPVKGSYSVLARRIDDAEALRAFLTSPAVGEFGTGYLAIFNRLLAAFTRYDVDGSFFLAEELLHGDLVTVEGFVCDGEVTMLGVVDSILHPNGSFARFDYPSSLPAALQQRMQAIAARAVRALGLERTLFNVELMFDRSGERIAIVEVNPRICGQFGDLYQKVDGSNGFEVALALCTGEQPVVRRGGGRYATASSVPLRVFEPVQVLAAPDAQGIAAAEALFAETLVWSECAVGETLADFERGEDGASHRYAVVNLGGRDRAEIAARLEAVQRQLGYQLRPLG